MEFLWPLLTTLVVSLVVTLRVIWFFRKPVDKMLYRVIGDEVAKSWRKFLTFAMLVVGGLPSNPLYPDAYQSQVRGKSGP